MTRFLSTAYGPPWEGIQGTGVTATGIDLRKGPVDYIVAVDPSVIPLHSKLAIDPNPFGSVVVFRAEDTGGQIKGRHIDFYDWRGRKSQNAWGSRYVNVTVLGKATTPLKPSPVSPGPKALPTRPSIETASALAGETRYDYSIVLRSSAHNLQRTGAYLRDAGDAIRRIQR